MKRLFLILTPARLFLILTLTLLLSGCVIVGEAKRFPAKIKEQLPMIQYYLLCTDADGYNLNTAAACVDLQGRHEERCEGEQVIEYSCEVLACKESRQACPTQHTCWQGACHNITTPTATYRNEIPGLLTLVCEEPCAWPKLFLDQLLIGELASLKTIFEWTKTYTELPVEIHMANDSTCSAGPYRTFPSSGSIVICRNYPYAFERPYSQKLEMARQLDPVTLHETVHALLTTRIAAPLFEEALAYHAKNAVAGITPCDDRYNYRGRNTDGRTHGTVQVAANLLYDLCQLGLTAERIPVLFLLLDGKKKQLERRLTLPEVKEVVDDTLRRNSARAFAAAMLEEANIPAVSGMDLAAESIGFTDSLLQFKICNYGRDTVPDFTFQYAIDGRPSLPWGYSNLGHECRKWSFRTNLVPGQLALVNLSLDTRAQVAEVDEVNNQRAATLFVPDPRTDLRVDALYADRRLPGKVFVYVCYSGPPAESFNIALRAGAEKTAAISFAALDDEKCQNIAFDYTDIGVVAGAEATITATVEIPDFEEPNMANNVLQRRIRLP